MFITTLKENKQAFITYLIFLAFGFAIWMNHEKLAIQIATNGYASDTLDLVFLFITKLAEGWLTVPLLVYLFVIDWKKGLFIGLSYGISALIVFLVKTYALPLQMRPFGVNELETLEGYHWINDYHMPRAKSFPSGHTTTAFSIFFGLAFLVKKKWLGIPFVFLAVLIGFSRTILSFHFLEDILVGSFLGMITSFILFLAFARKWEFVK